MTQPQVLAMGADFSTDTFTAAIGDSTPQVLETIAFKHQDEFGEKYGLQKGGYIERDGGVVGVPYGLIWDGLDLMLERIVAAIKTKGLDPKQLKRITISAQQHGMGAWKKGGYEQLDAFGADPTQECSGDFANLFATEMATSWRDTSTKEFCEQLEDELEPKKWAQISGSAPSRSLRFLGPQAEDLFSKNRDAFNSTEQFTVIASIIAALLTGRPQGIGGDEASMTLLMNLQTGKWDDQLLRNFPEELRERLPKIVPPGVTIGTIWSYWAERHGLATDCIVNMGFGDNIAAAITGRGVMLSLGSSGTVYQELQHPTHDPHFHCHVLRGAERYMAMFCTDQCGKLANEVRERVSLNWSQFDSLAASPQWVDPEEWVFPNSDGLISYATQNHDAIPGAVARSIIGNMHRHCAFLGSPESIVITGGFGTKPIAQIIADMWQTPVSITPKVNRVAYGSLIWSLSMHTGMTIGKLASYLCPQGEVIKPDPKRIDFYNLWRNNFNKKFPM